MTVLVNLQLQSKSAFIFKIIFTEYYKLYKCISVKKTMFQLYKHHSNKTGMKLKIIVKIEHIFKLIEIQLK